MKEKNVINISKLFWTLIPDDKNCKSNVGKGDFASKFKCEGCKIISRFRDLNRIIISKSFTVEIYNDEYRRFVIYEDYLKNGSYYIDNKNLSYIYDTNSIDNTKLLRADNCTTSVIIQLLYSDILIENKIPVEIILEYLFRCKNSCFIMYSYRNSLRRIMHIREFLIKAKENTVIEIIRQIALICTLIPGLYYGSGVEDVYVKRKDWTYTPKSGKKIVFKYLICLSSFNESFLTYDNSSEGKITIFSDKTIKEVMKETSNGLLNVSQITFSNMVRDIFKLEEFKKFNNHEEFPSCNRMAKYIYDNIMSKDFLNEFYKKTFNE